MKIESTNVQLPLQPPLLIADVGGVTSWDEWLSETETKLKELGYRRYVQNHKDEDFCYRKTFKNGEDEIYQIGILFYDFRKYADRDPRANRIGIMYECMVLGEDGIDMFVSKNIDLVEFENIAKTLAKFGKNWIEDSKDDFEPINAMTHWKDDDEKKEVSMFSRWKDEEKIEYNDDYEPIIKHFRD